MTTHDPMAGWRHAAATADVTLELPNGGGPMFFRAIPAGEFVMGSRGTHGTEEPRVRVRIERGFWMATFPVTQRQFRAFTFEVVNKHLNHFDAKALPGANHDQLPAESMNWYEALDFCRWLGGHPALVNRLAGCTPDLPTEAEWEYACRAWTSADFWSGDGEAALRRVGMFGENWQEGPSVVGSKGLGGCNGFGLFDMHGNVDEWCLDRWDSRRYRVSIDGDPDVARESSINDRHLAVYKQAGRVVRGGSFGNSAKDCRSAVRFGGGPSQRLWIRGFRVCLLPGPSTQRSARSSAAAADRTDSSHSLSPRPS